MSSRPPIAPDVAMALGIVSTAMPFVRTPEEAAERWLRVLRLNGEVRVALEALKISEGPLQGLEGPADRESANGAKTDSEDAVSLSSDPNDAVSLVTERAVQIARARSAEEVATTDLLMAVMQVYGADFDRVLSGHGANRDELIEQLGASTGAGTVS